MTNLKLILPPRHKQVTKPGYKEVIIPAPEARVLISIITEAFIPQLCKPTFKVKTLNEIQSKVLPTAFASDINTLIFAPTGARITNIELLAILRLLEKKTKVQWQN